LHPNNTKEHKLMAFTKPTDAEVREYAASTASNEGITGYAVAGVVNQWLEAEGSPVRVEQSRIYSQFAKKVNGEGDRSPGNAKRFTEQGANKLAGLVYKHVLSGAPLPEPDEDEDETDEVESNA